MTWKEYQLQYFFLFMLICSHSRSHIHQFTFLVFGCLFVHLLLQPNIKLFATSLLLVLWSLVLVYLLFPCNNIHKNWIFAYKIKLVLCFDIVQNSRIEHFLNVPFHIAINHGYNTRPCDFHHGMYGIVPNCGSDIQFTCPSSFFEFEFYCHGSFHSPSKCRIFVVYSHNQRFFYILFFRCFVARIKVLGEANKHYLYFQFHVHQIIQTCRTILTCNGVHLL